VALAEAIVLLLRPLRRLRLPIDEFGLLTLVALRFIPVLAQEAEQLLKAQLSRGADFSKGSLPARLRAASTLLVPLLQGAMRRAEQLGAALESRGYGVSGQAMILHEMPLAALDWAMLLGGPARDVARLLAPVNAISSWMGGILWEGFQPMPSVLRHCSAEAVN